MNSILFAQFTYYIYLDFLGQFCLKDSAQSKSGA